MNMAAFCSVRHPGRHKLRHRTTQHDASCHLVLQIDDLSFTIDKDEQAKVRTAISAVDT